MAITAHRRHGAVGRVRVVRRAVTAVASVAGIMVDVVRRVADVDEGVAREHADDVVGDVDNDHVAAAHRAEQVVGTQDRHVLAHRVGGGVDNCASMRQVVAGGLGTCSSSKGYMTMWGLRGWTHRRARGTRGQARVRQWIDEWSRSGCVVAAWRVARGGV